MTRTRPFCLVAAIIFGLIAVIHLYRLATHLPVTLGNHSIPISLSIVAIVVAAVLAVGLFRESRTP